MKFNAHRISALYALKGTVKKEGELELDQDDSLRILVQHPDGRRWLITEGTTVNLNLEGS